MPPCICLADYEHAARACIDAVTWEYIESGAADELTLRANVDAWQRLRIVPRHLRNVPAIDTRCTLLGHELTHPVLLAPIACHGLVHPDAELATARGARAAGAGMVLSSYATLPVEDVARDAPPLFWFQLYVQDRYATTAVIRRAASAGCSAIVITIDTPVSGARDRQARAGFEFPTDLPHITGVAAAQHPLTWDDLGWIREAASLPLVLKGVLHPDDAELAIAAGADAIIVSNHGGRNLDTTPATIDALPRIVDRVAGRIPVLVDGGIRRGTDVLKALAHGADAVLIGRPYIHGLAVDGAQGVQAVIDILRRELELAMMLCGSAAIADVDRKLFF